MSKLLEVEDLSIAYLNSNGGGDVHALAGLSFGLEKGEALGIAGETGSGKTTLALALMGLLPGVQISGNVHFMGQHLPVHNESAMRPFRWSQIALAFQSSGSAFNPVSRIGQQVIEPMLVHQGLTKTEAKQRAISLWENIGLPLRRFDAYPHQLSGGEKQRAMLVMALSCEPDLLIVDEPTSGLDVISKARIRELLQNLRSEWDFGLILISHDLSDLARICERSLILYAGRAAELGDTRLVLEDPRHPYSWGLVNAFPRMDRSKDLSGIRGQYLDQGETPQGCPFHPRCTQVVDHCKTEVPLLETYAGREVACHLGGLQTLLQVRDLTRKYPRSDFAVRSINLEVREGEVVALVGETGSGKTTLAKCLVGLEKPQTGQILLEGQDLLSLNGRELLRLRQRIQMIFQDPFEALSPRLKVLDLVQEPLDIQKIGTSEERRARVEAALAAVRLPVTPAFLSRHGHELSGGQLQRVAIARALILQPKLILADEPVAMLDASEQAQLIRLLKEVQNEYGMGLLLISHDLALVRKIADRIVVMNQGKVVESGPSQQILERPVHEYTRALITAAKDSLFERRYNTDEAKY